jgi:hypothetical protein
MLWLSRGFATGFENVSDWLNLDRRSIPTSRGNLLHSNRFRSRTSSEVPSFWRKVGKEALVNQNCRYREARVNSDVGVCWGSPHISDVDFLPAQEAFQF